MNFDEAYKKGHEALKSKDLVEAQRCFEHALTQKEHDIYTMNKLAMVYKDKCVWCDECTNACPYNAIIKVDYEGKSVAYVEEAKCKGCGMCLPVCPENAIDMKGFTDAEIETMIDALIL